MGRVHGGHCVLVSELEVKQAQDRTRAVEEVLQRKEWEWTKVNDAQWRPLLCIFTSYPVQSRLEKESDLNRTEWELRKEREKVQILMRPSTGLASPTSAIAANPAEVKELKVLNFVPVRPFVYLTYAEHALQATKEALEKRVNELEKEKLVISEQLAEEQLNGKNTRTQLENKVQDRLQIFLI